MIITDFTMYSCMPGLIRENEGNLLYRCKVKASVNENYKSLNVAVLAELFIKKISPVVPKIFLLNFIFIKPNKY